MGGLQGHVQRRAMNAGFSASGAGSRESSSSPPRGIDLDGTAKHAAGLLYPLLLESLHPQQFSGDLGLSIHIQEGRIYHIREFITSKEQPGVVRGGLQGSQQTPPDDLGGNVLESAIASLRGQLSPISSDYFGVITLTIEVRHGICRMVQCGRERVYKSPRG